MKITKILSEFRGLKHSADARNHGVRKKLGSVRDTKGNLQTERKGVVDAFADFYAQLYATRGDAHIANEPLGGDGVEVREIDAGAVKTHLEKMANGKSRNRSGNGQTWW